MAVPTVSDVTTYLGTDNGSWDNATITSAYNAEKAAQAMRCRVPLDTDVWPADLAEALKRRVAANLALRKLPLGVSATVTDLGAAAYRVGGGDAEVRRLEAPYRRLVVG